MKYNVITGFSSHVEQKLKIYQQAMELAGYNKLIMASGASQLQFRDDLHFPYKVNPYFVEWVPLLQHQGSYLVIEDGKRPRLYIHVPIDYWHSACKPLQSEYAVPFDTEEFHDQPAIDSSGRIAFIGEALELPLDEVDVNPDVLLNFIDYHRAWKTDYEQYCLRVANQIASAGHRAAEAAFRSGESEYSIHIEYLKAIRSQEHELPYDSIIALNENAAVLHHMLLSKEKLERNRSFLIDAGARFNGYGADISRTYVGDGELDEFAALIEAVDRAQQRLVNKVQIGRPYTEVHEHTHELVSQILSDLQIVSCSAEQTLDSGLSRVFLPHGVGHLLGVQVHDRGGHMATPDGTLLPPPSHYPALRCTRTIEEGMVFTIEPGIYFIQSLLEAWPEPSLLNKNLINELSKYGGVRIEDNIVARVNNNENLTRDAFSMSV